jgi:hypothetical protein
MRLRLVAALLLCGLSSLHRIRAQGIDPNLMREVDAVRVQVARSSVALRQYTWTENTEVLVNGSVKSSSSVICRYDDSGALIKTQVGPDKENKMHSETSNRPIVRKEADMQDYIQRAVGRIHDYLPPKPEEMDYLLRNGHASLGQSSAGKSEVRLTHYFEDGDSLVFAYDSVSKVLLRIDIASTLGSPKDPVTMEADFETLPDGVNHLGSTTLIAKSKKVQVKTQNVMYQKVAP